MWQNSSKADLYEGIAKPEAQGWLKNESGYFTGKQKKYRNVYEAPLNSLTKDAHVRVAAKRSDADAKRMIECVVLPVSAEAVLTLTA